MKCNTKFMLLALMAGVLTIASMVDATAKTKKRSTGEEDEDGNFEGIDEGFNHPEGEFSGEYGVQSYPPLIPPPQQYGGIDFQLPYQPIPEAQYQVQPEVQYQQHQPQYTQQPQYQPLQYQQQPEVLYQPEINSTYNTQNNAILSYPQSTFEQIPPVYQQQTNYVPLKQYYQPLQIQTSYQPQPQTLFYSKPNSAYKVCPKNFYSNPPTASDIQAAFAWAAQQVSAAKGQTIQYMSSKIPSWSNRHQMFSIMASPGVKSDEEGLLLEYASQYISDRLCMSKWDRQKFLPSLSKIASNGNYYPANHQCKYATTQSPINPLQCLSSKYRNYDGYCNNPWHPYWGKSSVCHIRILSPDYADGISAPRESSIPGVTLPNPRALSDYIHNDLSIWGPYNLMKMQWGQFINHDITNTAVSSYEGLVDCCRNPGVQGCMPIYVAPNDKFYSRWNTTCLNFIRSAVCPVCQLGPRQQLNKNTAFLDASHMYGNNLAEATRVRAFVGGLLKSSRLKSGEEVLPIDGKSNDKSCASSCYFTGDSRNNQHPALTALHVLGLRRHNQLARALYQRHPNWNDETIFQEARRIFIAEYQMITYNEYLPIVFGPQLSAYYKLRPQASNYTIYHPEADPTTWNEYVTASCRFGHSQVTNMFSILKSVIPEGNEGYVNNPKNSYKLQEWFNRPSFINDGLTDQIINGLVSRGSQAVDQWVVDDLRNWLYKSPMDKFGGDLPATNIQRGRDHGIPAYIHYLEYCSKVKIRNWQDLAPFFEPKTLSELRNMYKFVENIDLFTGGLSERHAPGADTGLTFACINGIQYYHSKFGDRYYFEHGGQAGSFTPQQLQEIRRTTLARFLCKTTGARAMPMFAFLKAGRNNPLIDCLKIGDLNFNLF